MKKIFPILKKIYAILIILTAIIICSGSVGFSIFAVISFSFYISLTLFFIFLTRQSILPLIVSSSLIICLQLLNQIKVHFYKERLFFADFYVAIDPENFSTLIHYPSALIFLLALVAFLVINFWVFWSKKRISYKLQFVCLIFSVASLSAAIYISQQDDTNRLWQQFLPKGRGTIANLFISSNQMTYEPPCYSRSSDYFLEKSSAIENDIDNAKQNPHKKPDIVVFLQESTVNPQLFNIQSNNLPHYDMFSEPNSNLMRVQTFGGGTWLTEFAILTGLNSNDFSFRKNSVYYAVAPHVQTSLFKELNENGYYTVVLSPMAYGNYNAGPSYTSFGMQQFFMPQDLGYQADKNENLWKIPTKDLLDKVKTILETYTDKPLFIFVLSMNEHGPYDPNHADDYQLGQDIADSQFVGRLNDYLNRIESLNSATQDFNNYIKQRENPTLFVYFGDHQPNLSWHGDYKTKLKQADFLTQYTLSTNYPTKVEHNELTDASLIGGLILEKSGVQYSDFYKANIAMRYLCGGKLNDCEDQKLVESYKHYIYQDLKDAGSATKH
ncbi:LTA synthase family protein [Orbus sturtevantii]|uniref:LTA synthase family protein n=1 Tax=Orbus sturtevantii TaxID=3074109 RepID=UPI00370DCCBC